MFVFTNHVFLFSYAICHFSMSILLEVRRFFIYHTLLYYLKSNLFYMWLAKQKYFIFQCTFANIICQHLTKVDYSGNPLYVATFCLDVSKERQTFKAWYIDSWRTTTHSQFYIHREGVGRTRDNLWVCCGRLKETYLHAGLLRCVQRYCTRGSASARQQWLTKIAFIAYCYHIPRNAAE